MKTPAQRERENLDFLRVGDKVIWHTGNARTICATVVRLTRRSVFIHCSHSAIGDRPTRVRWSSVENVENTHGRTKEGRQI